MKKPDYMASSEELYKALTTQHFVMSGPCVLESYELAYECACQVKEAAINAGLIPIFKSSYDKANRTSLSSFRGPGLHKGLEWLARIREEVGIPTITDIHEPEQAAIVGQVVDILQIPAFLCRQTSLLQASAATNKIVNIKKGQFLAPADIQHAANKVVEAGNSKVLLTERGTSFGYNNLVVDMRSFPIMNTFGFPTVMDATHSVQLPGGLGNFSGGDRSMVPTIARAAVVAGAKGVFLECHPTPDKALCDGPNSIELAQLPHLLTQLTALWKVLDYDA